MPVESSVIIPTYQRAAVLAETLDALGRQTTLDFEVIVVSDGSDQETSDLARTYKAAFPLRWIFNPQNQGQASARNTGAAAAESDILLFLDDDTTPLPGCVEQHLRRRRKFGEGAEVVVLGRIRHQYSQPPKSHTERLLREVRDRALEQYEAAAAGMRLEYGKMAACGLNASLCRGTFWDAGGYDTSLNYVDEDTEFGARLYDRGVRFVF
ncbi:MAG: glycosyltransferase, partial [Acidobacteria bacterium]|nr:glycosyltransferase [Acidobacteriota bacterium]